MPIWYKLSRVSPKISCEIVLTKEQWMTLCMLIQKTKDVYESPPSINEAVRWIGKLGGHLFHKQDGETGL